MNPGHEHWWTGLFIKPGKKFVTPCPVNQWAATTKRCHSCHYIFEILLPLSECIFYCPNPNCFYVVARNLNASRSIEDLRLEFNHHQYYYVFSQSGVERIVVPAETSTATRNKKLHDDLVVTLNRIPFVRASVLNEADSLKLKSWKPKTKTQDFNVG